MSVFDRILDAELLWDANRKESAYLLILVAVAATARKRYPRPIGDREAFTNFIKDEIKGINGGIGLGLPMTSGKAMLLEDMLYEHFRCMLVHQAELSKQVILSPRNEIVIGYPDDTTRPSAFPEQWVLNLKAVVVRAPENTD